MKTELWCSHGGRGVRRSASKGALQFRFGMFAMLAAFLTLIAFTHSGSPDLLAAESNLIAAAGVMQLTTRNLARLRELYTTRAISQRDLEQAISDQQTAEGNVVMAVPPWPGAKAACARFCASAKALPADQAMPLWQAAQAELARLSL